MGRRYVSADVAPHRGLYAVSADDDPRDDIVAVLEAQADTGRLIGQADQPVTQLDTVRRHGGSKKPLERRAMKHQERRTHLAPVPLRDRVGPQETAIAPAAELNGRRHVRDLRQVDAQALQQAGRVAADRDPGADFPKAGILLEDLDRYRLLLQARRERQAADASADNGDVTRAGHISCYLALHRGQPLGVELRMAFVSCLVRVPGGLPGTYR
jgi:hypothetical protein